MTRSSASADTIKVKARCTVRGSKVAWVPIRIFEQEQIARAVELGLGVAGPDAIEIVTRDAESARYAEKLRAILRLG